MIGILLWPVLAHKKRKGVGDRVRRSLYAHAPRKPTRSLRKGSRTSTARQLRAVIDSNVAAVRKFR
jgi:hypothetical protein